MNKLHHFILRISTWYVWLAFLLGTLAFNVYVMPKAANTLKASCGENVKIPDLEIGYTGGELKGMISFMTEACRNEYYYIATVTDSFYPLVYGLFLFFTIVILYYKTQVPLSKGKLYVFPIATILADFAENLTIGKLLFSKTPSDDYLYHFASAFSMMKWFFAIASAVLILLGIVRWLLHRFQKTA